MPRPQLLNIRHTELLKDLDRTSGMPKAAIDGRLLRTLVSKGLVRVNNDRVDLTPLGRQSARDTSGEENGSAQIRLNDQQAAMLREIVRQGGAVSAEQLDGRVAQALARRGLLRFNIDSVVLTQAGWNYKWVANEPAVRETARRRSAGAARAAAIWRAVELLDRALPAGAEVLVGPIMAAAQDLVDGFRKYARDLERSKRVPR